MSSKWTSRALTDRLFPSANAAPFGRPLKQARGARIPVILVSGFLGAGKTTVIQTILASEAGARTAVIVNEFGEVGIDHAILRAHGENTVLLGNGCLCCGMRSDLEETLAELVAEATIGAIPGFDRVIVETSGLADPAPILQTFVADRGIGREFHLETVITVADAPTIEANLEHMAEVERQVLMADRIVVSKTDLVPAEAAARVERLLAELNPTAAIGRASDGLDVATLLRAPPYPRAEISGHVHHTGGVASFTLFLDEAVAWPVFAHAMDVLIDLRGEDLLRMKGLVAVRGRPGPLVVHAVRHIMHPPVELAAWPDEDRRSRLVFIVRGIGRDEVAALLRATQNLAARPADA